MGNSLSLLDDNDASNGRIANRPRSESRDRKAPPQNYPQGYHFHPYGPEEDSSVEPSQQDERKPLKVLAVDFCIEKNVRDHHTDLYDITEVDRTEDGISRTPELVIRRGSPFEIKLSFDRSFDQIDDEIEVNFEIGSQPKGSKDTWISLDPGKITRESWCFEIESVSDKVVTIKVQASPMSIVGKWAFIIHTSLKSVVEKKDVFRYLHNHPVYILFNPWCRDDPVYSDDEVMLDENTLNDTGKLFRGSVNQIGGDPWNFGQFEEDILDCSMNLLCKAMNMKYQGRGDPVHVVRAISAIVNSQDDRGVLVGKWSRTNDYKDGTAPTAWIGSVRILQQYHKTQKPVKYGQCWVFSGVVTTVCRALGIPCRSVTNFNSAHDCDDNITIDKHWDMNGEPINDLNEDSIWNFHIWNEAWMARPDLPTGYGGWQAFDATPQETSGGVYCAGPASVKAIKEGMLNTRYDTAFIYAEINADRVHWKQQLNGKFKVEKVEKHIIGKKISTNFPRLLVKDKRQRSFLDSKAEDQFRLDITDQYKYGEGTEEERAAMYRAHVKCTSTAGLHVRNQREAADVKFTVSQKDNILVGSPFNVVLNLQNQSRFVRTIIGNIKIRPVLYTGVGEHVKDVKTLTFETVLQAVKNEDVVLRVSVEDYVDKMLDQTSFEIFVSATVDETSQTELTIHPFRLRRPDLHLMTPKETKVGETVTIRIFHQNPLPLTLTECEWYIEGLGTLLNPKQSDIEPNGSCEVSVQMIPKRSGTKEIMASFTSHQLTSVTGSCSIKVNN